MVTVRTGCSLRVKCELLWMNASEMTESKKLWALYQSRVLIL